MGAWNGGWRAVLVITGKGRIGVTRIKLGPREVAFAAVQYPLLQAEPEVGDGWVKFVQSAGGHMGLPAPRLAANGRACGLGGAR